jgi:hypothetical protein
VVISIQRQPSHTPHARRIIIAAVSRSSNHTSVKTSARSNGFAARLSVGLASQRPSLAAWQLTGTRRLLTLDHYKLPRHPPLRNLCRNIHDLGTCSPTHHYFMGCLSRRRDRPARTYYFSYSLLPSIALLVTCPPPLTRRFRLLSPR